MGKSSVVAQVTRSLGIGLVDLRASQLDVVDLRGCPLIEKGRTKWAPPEFLPEEGEGILLLDEIDKATNSVQAGLLQLVLDRRMGEYPLPAGWWVVAAANRLKDRAGSGRLISPLLNRFAHIFVDPCPEEWQRWALEAGVRPEVRAFLKFKPNLLHVFKPHAPEEEVAFPTPRSWKMASDILGSSPPQDLLHSLISGTVGTAAAAELLGFLDVWGNIPDVDRVLNDPDRHPLPSELIYLHALGAALVERLRPSVPGTLPDLETTRKVVRVMTRFPQEIQGFMFRDAVVYDRRVVDARTLGLPQVGAMLERLAPYLKRR